LKRVIGQPTQLETLLVERAMVPATEHDEVRKRRRTTLRPVADMVGLAESHRASRKAATAIPVLERPSYRGRDRAGTRADLHEAPRIVFPHHHPRGVACQALRRFPGNARPVLDHRLAGLIRVGEHRRVDWTTT
jgi:hypothetical protein